MGSHVREGVRSLYFVASLVDLFVAYQFSKCKLMLYIRERDGSFPKLIENCDLMERKEVIDRYEFPYCSGLQKNCNQRTKNPINCTYL